MNDPALWRPVAFQRRLLLVALVAAQTLAGLWLFAQSLPDQAGTWPSSAALAVFGVLFAWIGVGFWTAVFGFVVLRFGGDPWSLSEQHAARTTEAMDLAPTAVIMPIYHEPVQRTLAGLKAIFRDLEQTGRSKAVDFYVLSDSRDPEVWLEEQAACTRLREELGAHQRLFYRRRTINQNYKSGNIADFLRRWGRQYRYMVVLDADSLLSADCITRLIDLMESRPQAGIIQTTPRLGRAETRFARLQQFANRCYGRLYSAGLASIQLGEATYWGHNAIIRTEPFMRHCGLRKLRGPGLFRGPVLSHDFIEAALMGRAGYEVWLEPSISGSFEESPPTLEDDLVRDRRWCRGNLQHLWLLATLSRLRLAHRMALLTGILSYLASPLWLLFLGLSGYVALAGPESAPALPGVLANADTATDKGMLLVSITALLLFGPRLLALTDQTLAKRTGKFGGMPRLCASTLTETLAALALAPIRMFAHTLFVIRALFNLTVGWQGQNRTNNSSPATRLRQFGLPVLMASVTLGLIQWQIPVLTPWALPVTLPVLLAPVLTGWLNRQPAGQNWLLTPEDHQSPAVIDRARNTTGCDKPWQRLSWVEQIVLSPAYARTCGRDLRVATGRKQQTLQRLVEICALNGQSALNNREMSLICSHPAALEALHLRVWQTCASGPWQQALTRMVEGLETSTGQHLTSIPHYSEEVQWIDAAS
ncbi:glucans biosynthesis glucosyltransferase MdoH [Marinobacter confluentis]|uniref:Glucans biosynthesis glucosyltransferase H n=1 Tax=Marinobacter confluentis TaxID=1697557 RepID=A0A4Z1BY40_9GAMM|nr:glucans biosynthesis glucosyltransferase MdoH [Marinobacter confluentis]TGN39440.1 glucans biosynthesis glucosyltransferase MdoH [Marinobacter confluentis]